MCFNSNVELGVLIIRLVLMRLLDFGVGVDNVNSIYTILKVLVVIKIIVLLLMVGLKC